LPGGINSQYMRDLWKIRNGQPIAHYSFFSFDESRVYFQEMFRPCRKLLALPIERWASDERFTGLRDIFNGGRSLADPESSGQAAIRHTHFGFYLVADQMVWRKPGTTDQGLGLFARMVGDPSQGNQLKFYADGGITCKGILPSRADDVFGIAVAYAKVSNEARGFDGDTNRFTGSNRPIRDFETVLEVTYKAQLAPWWSVQPDLQLIFHPGANVARPNDPNGTLAMPNAMVLGVRTAIAF